MVSKVEKTGKPGRPKGIPKTGGRKKGTPNKATASIKDIAREHTEDAVRALVDVLREGSDTAKVSAAKEILDRGYGKASQVVSGDEDGGAIIHKIELVALEAANSASS